MTSARTTPAAPAASTAANKALISALYDAANARNPDAIRGLCTPEFGEWMVRAITGAWARSDAPWQVLDMIAEGDQVAVRWKKEGRWTGAYEGIPLPPGGEQLTQDGIRIWRIEDGKISGSDWATNHLPALRQLGVVPPAPQSAGAASR